MKIRNILFLLACAAGSLCAEAPSAIALQHARVVTVSGATLERATVLVRDGIIEAVGEQVSLPADAWIIEAQGLTVYPGWIDALSSLGMPEAAPPPTAASRAGPAPAPSASAPVSRGPEDRPSNTSWLRAADLVSPADRRIHEARDAGFTAAVVFPATGIFAGQGAFLNLAGERGRMVLASPAGQYVSLTTRRTGDFPNSLMGALAYVRQVFLDAAHYRLERDAWERHARGARRPDYDRAIEGLLESPRVLLPARSAVELERMARFAEGLQAKAVLYGAHEGYRVAALLARFSQPVLVSLKWPARLPDADPDAPEPLRVVELRERAPSTPAVLAKAGVPFAFYLDGASPRDARKAVKRAIDAGLAPADALRALTLSAAQIYGLADRLGSIEKGKMANLVVTDGDLFQEQTKIRYIFVDGVKFEPGPEAPPPARTPVTEDLGATL